MRLLVSVPVRMPARMRTHLHTVETLVLDRVVDRVFPALLVPGVVHVSTSLRTKS